MESESLHIEVLEQNLRRAARTVLSGYQAYSGKAKIAREINDAKAAIARGYYTPDEDERLRETFVQYLQIRRDLWQAITEVLHYVDMPRGFKKGNWHAHLKAFAIGFAGASFLIRSGYYLIDMAQEYDLVRAKLDEAEPRYGLERKQFKRLYESLVSTRRMARYKQACEFYGRYKDEIYAALDTPPYSEIADMLRVEEPYFQTRLRAHFKRKARFNLFRLRRRRQVVVHQAIFFLFEAAGSDIAELKQPLVKPRGAPKRVNDEVRAQLLELALPGDVFVTRHDDALSNVFLPGFWPHAALYIGTDMDRAALGVAKSRPEYQSEAGPVEFLESKKDGVLFRPAKDTLQVDNCVILRPKLSKPVVQTALNRALSHAGKLYDFVFDFTTSDRLVCTELIYRTYHDPKNMPFILSEKAGRLCLSAEDFLNQALGHDWFEVVAVFGVGGDTLYQGEAALQTLLKSFDYKAA
ncbi:MAG TPA: hypothetical protein ENJ42_02770 [Hellea balneolensis]|uniref:Permuted papain-like amidase enzyme, YaeF/YiiX, C92 family n=1 Tax=Hellea balneolensis TaxID=287478 RepID=A0A7C5LS04_9PROT|nr:hypothetical protein [Hellea balneolensis]